MKPGTLKRSFDLMKPFRDSYIDTSNPEYSWTKSPPICTTNL